MDLGAASLNHLPPGFGAGWFAGSAISCGPWSSTSPPALMPLRRSWKTLGEEQDQRLVLVGYSKRVTKALTGWPRLAEARSLERYLCLGPHWTLVYTEEVSGETTDV